MKILKDLIAKAEDTLDEIEWYAKEALILRNEHKELSDVYIKIAESHVSIYNMLHERMVALIGEQRKTGTPPPVGMLEIWNYEHEKLIKEFSEAKFLVEEYKKTY
jgi:hypothetical protein